VIQLHFYAANNVAGYEALVNGPCITAELVVQQLYIHEKSELVINQVIESQIVVTPAWLHTGKTSGSWRRNSMVLNSTISSSGTMRQPMPSPNSSQAVNHPL
jgi:hypothetical protein